MILHGLADALPDAAYASVPSPKRSEAIGAAEVTPPTDTERLTGLSARDGQRYKTRGQDKVSSHVRRKPAP